MCGIPRKRNSRRENEVWKAIRFRGGNRKVRIKMLLWSFSTNTDRFSPTESHRITSSQQQQRETVKAELLQLHFLSLSSRFPIQAWAWLHSLGVYSLTVLPIPHRKTEAATERKMARSGNERNTSRACATTGKRKGGGVTNLDERNKNPKKKDHRMEGGGGWKEKRVDE